MKQDIFTRLNLSRFCMIGVTAVIITVTGILFRQSVLHILPLYVSLIVGMLQSRANRYAYLLGGLNSILYMLVYLYLGLFASAAYCLLFSFPMQIATFIKWGHNRRGHSTVFRRMSGKLRILISAGFLAAFVILYFVLKATGASHQLLDNLSSLLGTLTAVLTMLAFIEYTWIMLPSGLISIALNIATMTTHPEQITYLVYSIYSFICIVQQFFRVRKLYAEQNILN